MTFDQTFTFTQALDLIGMLQCVFILSIVYLHAVDLRLAAPSIVFFAVLGLSFGLPAAGNNQDFVWQTVSIWIAQAWIPTVSYLLILQRSGRQPRGASDRPLRRSRYRSAFPAEPRERRVLRPRAGRGSVSR